ncbi:MAG: MarR family winged helix-turn-helix transcriptional regulator [Acidimicrobiales bacterium]
MTSGHELDAPPWLRVESTIMATARAIRQCYDQRFADLGLNLSEASLLAFVEESGPLTQTRLAQRLGLGRAATGSVIDSLEKRGLVERQPDPDDRRVWLVTVTRTGKDLVEQVNASDQVLRSELRAGISRADRQQLAALLVRLQENLAAALDDGRSSTGGATGP